MHLRVNEHGLPLQIELSPGEAHDAPMAELLLQDLPKGTSLLADRGYDADWIREMIEDQNCTPVIPPKSNRREEIPLLKAQVQETQSRRTLYQQAQAVQAHRNTIQQVRFSLPRLAKLGAIRLWLRFYESAA
jgi:transposase